MKNKFFIAVFLSLFITSSPAYATFDIMATIQSGMELYKEVETKVQAIQKKISDIKKRVTQGFTAAANCFKNPLKCDIKTIVSVAGDAKGAVNAINKVKALENSGLDDGEISGKDSNDLEESVLEAYQFKKGEKNSLSKTAEQRKKLNAVVADDIAALFAKGMVVRELIRQEDAEELYSTDIESNQGAILAVQNAVVLKSQERLTRILELRSYMVSAQSSAELGRNSVSSEEQ